MVTVFENICKRSICSVGTNVQFSIILSIVFKVLLLFFLVFFSILSENDIMILKNVVKG